MKFKTITINGKTQYFIEDRQVTKKRYQLMESRFKRFNCLSTIIDGKTTTQTKYTESILK